MSMGRWWNDTDRRKLEVFKEKIIQVTLFLPQILRGLAWHRIWASVVRGRRLTACAMPRPLCNRGSCL